MSDVISQWAKTTRPTGQESPYRSSALALGRGAQAELKIELDITEENLGANDEWYFARLPADAIIDGAFLTVDQLDDGTDLELQIRADDGTTASNLLSAASEAGQTGGTVFANANLPYIGGDDLVEVYVRVTAAADDAVAGKATLTLRFSRA
jgi:hypothetical protein